MIGPIRTLKFIEAFSVIVNSSKIILVNAQKLLKNFVKKPDEDKMLCLAYTCY